MEHDRPMHIAFSYGVICPRLHELWKYLLHLSINSYVFIDQNKILKIFHISELKSGQCGLKFKEHFGLGVKNIFMVIV